MSPKPAMSALSDAQRTELREDLLKLRAELQETLSLSSEGARPVDLEEPIGRLSRMDAMQQQSMLKANRAAAQLRLAQVEGALVRHREEDYGECQGCGEWIGYPRLKARPEAPFCLSCQGAQETRG
jgi:DnaK suppressor protein